jgi:hypothetical protein
MGENERIQHQTTEEENPSITTNHTFSRITSTSSPHEQTIINGTYDYEQVKRGQPY